MAAYKAVNSRGREYFLHAKRVVLQNGRQHTLFYFAPSERRGEATGTLPPNHTIAEDPRTGRLLVRRTAP